MAARISPQLSRKLKEKASLLLCQQCWVPLILIEKKGQPKPHPCLFCQACLEKCGSKPKYGEKSWRSLSFTAGPRSAGEWRPANKDAITRRNARGGGATMPAGRLARQPADRSEASVDSLDKAGGGDGGGGGDTVIQNSAFRGKLRQFEQTATRCGFCPRDEKRKRLASYCFHCRKHLCVSCSQKHGTERLYRYHATTDLTTTDKQGLQ